MFAQKLNLELERLGLKTVQQKADACGLQYEYMRQVLKGKALSEERIIEICKSLNLSNDVTARLILLKVQDRAKNSETKEILSKILSDYPVPSETQTCPCVKDRLPDNIVTLPEEYKTPIYSSIKGGDGELGITDGNIDGHIYISGEMIKQKVFCLRVSGDSMNDKIFDSEVAIFRPMNGNQLKDNGIYAIEVEGWSSWVVKHIRHDPSGIIQLISANSAYPVKEINPEISNVIIRGELIESRRLF